MPTISSLLGIVEIKNAEGLILATDEVPALIVDGTGQPLTMPPLSPSVLRAALEELLTPDLRALLDATGQIDATHAAGPRGTFALHVRVSGDRTEVTLRKGGRSAAPERVETTAGPGRDPAALEAGSFEPALDQAIAHRASDLLLSPGLPPFLRIDGTWTAIEAAPVTSADIEQAFFPRLTGERRRMLADAGSTDLAFGRPDPVTGEEIRFRVNLFRQHTGLAAALRPLRTALAGPTELNLPASIVPIVSVPQGLVLMTGATGSGKSTTLAALLEHVNGVRPCHIVTLEDPIEYVFRPRRAVIHQREIGTHVDGFASGLRAALRESPDIILVGEMRDRETIRLALTAAGTGHLVMSTLHSGTAALAIDRIVDAFEEAEKIEVRQQLAGVLRHVIAQQLVAGVRGDRLPVLEILTVTAAVAAQIREGRTHMLPAQMEVEAGERMVSMERALVELVRAGRLGRQVALDAAQRADEVRRLLDDRAPAAGRR